MKKVIFSFAIISMVFATSCSGDDDNNEKSCNTLTAELTSATEAFLSEDATEEDCLDFRAAANAYIDAECGTEQQRADLQILVDGTDCDQ